jgi:hypothetical protein
MNIVKSALDWAISLVSRRAASVVLALAIGSSALAANAAPPSEFGLLKLQARLGMARVSPSFTMNYGRYLGSGTGDVSGKVKGAVAWDLYEEQSNSALHRTQFVGWITAQDGSKVAFETVGYFIPRQGAKGIWDLTSAVYFSDATGEAYQALAGRIGLWQGHLEISEGDKKFVHTYHLFIPDQSE